MKSQNGDRKFSLVPNGSTQMAESQRKFSLDALVPSVSPARQNSTGTVEFEEELGSYEDNKWKGMYKDLYVDKKDRVFCLCCNRKFTLKFRPKHCRRCGEVFCIKCLQQKTRLNRLACPDPSGKERKICLACYEACKAVDGCSRSLTDEFVSERTMAKHEKVLSQRAKSLTTTFWRDQLDINSECGRLLRGFEQAVANSVKRLAFQEMRHLVNVPSWQQSPFWSLESQSDHCRACKGRLWVRKQHRNCRVCGLALCKRCSHKELLVFYPDKPSCGDLGSLDVDTASNSAGARLAVINESGAPDKEPAVSLLLYACADCKTSIAGRQTLPTPEWEPSLNSAGPLGTILGMNGTIQELQHHISNALICLEEGGINVNPLKPDTKIKHSSFDDIDCALRQYTVQFQRTKALLPLAQSKTQTLFIKNYIKARHEYFMESKHLLARQRRRHELLD